jgi:hypothetical protein
MHFESDHPFPAGNPGEPRSVGRHVEGPCADVPGGRADPTDEESFVLRDLFDQLHGDVTQLRSPTDRASEHRQVSLADVSRRTKPDPATSRAARGGSEMFEAQAGGATQPMPPIEVTDYVGMGSVVADWSTGQRALPRDVSELRDQLDGIATVSDRVTDLEFVQGTSEKLVIRLPVREMIEASIDAMTDPMAEGRYPLPQFYDDYHKPGIAPIMTPIDILFARVGDYTIAQCK